MTVTREGGDGSPLAYGRTNVEGIFLARLEAGTYRIELGTRRRRGKHTSVQVLTLDDGARREVRLTAP